MKNEEFKKIKTNFKDDSLTVLNATEYFNGDSFNPIKYFCYLYNELPNKLNFNYFSKKMEKEASNSGTKLSYNYKKFFDGIAKKYPNSYVNKNSFVDENAVPHMCYYGVIIPEIKTIAYVDDTDIKGLIVYYGTGFEKEAENVFKMLTKTAKLTRDKDARKSISLIVRDGNGYTTYDSEIKQVDVDIKKHYNAGFKEADKIIKDFIEEENTSGLVILNGEKGTGKTTYIRHLINTSSRQFIYLTKDMARALTDPGFISFLFRYKNCVLVIEDCENLVASRDHGNTDTGISNLLNLCDGLLSDVFNIKIITTFNTDVKNVDTALLRKGRLIYRYEFDKLSVDKANALLKSLKIDYTTTEPMSICDIFNYKKDTGNKKKESTKKIGF